MAAAAAQLLLACALLAAAAGAAHGQPLLLPDPRAHATGAFSGD